VNRALLDGLAQLRRRLADLGPATPEAAPAARNGPAANGPLDLLVTHNEISERHGTGVLLQRLFLGKGRLASVRSVDLYGGEQSLGSPRLRLDLQGAGWPEVMATVVRALGHLDVRRILCVPYGPAEVQVALAAREVFGAPMCTWVMDDQNIEARGLPDDLLRRLFERSSLLLAISTELQRAYQDKFGRPFALAPPVVSPAHVLRAPVRADPERLAARRGLVFGNIWGERWLEGLLAMLEGSGVALEWHSGGGTPWMQLDADRLGRAGLLVRPYLAEPSLVASLRASPFVVVPTGALDQDDSHGFLARLSLPSRLPYLAAVAGAPAIVLGHPETAAARFVVRHGLGRVVPYDRRAFAAAVEEVCRPENQARHRSAAARLAPILTAEGMVEWIWRSLETGAPIDRRFAPLECDT
jgi:hypothetical protein